MKSPFGHRRTLLAVAVAASLVTAGGVAWATIPAADGTIHACRLNVGGWLRAVDDPSRCRSVETAVDLGGPTRGLAFSADGDVSLGTTSTTVAQIDLQAGKYLIHGKVNLINKDFGDPDGAFVPCDLRIDGMTTMLDRDAVLAEGPVTTSEAYITDEALQAPLVVPTFARVLLECAAVPRGASTNVAARYRQLDAVQVDGLSAVTAP